MAKKNSKLGFLLGLHSVTFIIFSVVSFLLTDVLLGDWFLETLKGWFGEKRSAQVAEMVKDVVFFFVDLGLYIGLYALVYKVYKTFVSRVKKDILLIGGKWFHVHLKRDDAGYLKVDYLRAGETTVEQDLYDVTFTAKNYSYKLNEKGETYKVDSVRDNTGWTSYSIDWDGKERLVTCYRANTQRKKADEFTNRHGIHRLQISDEVMKGNFADEYPSASRGEIYFFRSEAVRDEFIKDFLTDGDLDNF